MELLNRGIELIFLDNPTLNTEYIKSMQNSAEKMKRENIVGGMTLEFVIRLLLVTELDKAEKERETTVKELKTVLQRVIRNPDAKSDNWTSYLRVGK